MIVTSYTVRCLHCDPEVEFDAVLIFHHLRFAHGIAMEIFSEGSEVPIPIVAEDSLRSYEADLDRLEGQVADQPWLLRPWFRWQIRRLRRDLSGLRDDQIQALLRGTSER